MPPLYKSISPFLYFQNSEEKAAKRMRVDSDNQKPLNISRSTRSEALNIEKNPTFQNILDFIKSVSQKLIALPSLPEQRIGIDENIAIKEREDYITLLVKNYIPQITKQFNTMINNGIYAKSITLEESKFLREEFRNTITIPLYEDKDLSNQAKINKLKKKFEKIQENIRFSQGELPREDFNKYMQNIKSKISNLNNLIQNARFNPSSNLGVNFDNLLDDAYKLQNRLTYDIYSTTTEELNSLFRDYRDRFTQQEQNEIQNLLRKCFLYKRELNVKKNYSIGEFNKKIILWGEELGQLKNMLDEFMWENSVFNELREAQEEEEEERDLRDQQEGLLNNDLSYFQEEQEPILYQTQLRPPTLGEDYTYQLMEQLDRDFPPPQPIRPKRSRRVVIEEPVEEQLERDFPPPRPPVGESYFDEVLAFPPPQLPQQIRPSRRRNTRPKRRHNTRPSRRRQVVSEEPVEEDYTEQLLDQLYREFPPPRPPVGESYLDEVLALPQNRNLQRRQGSGKKKSFGGFKLATKMQASGNKKLISGGAKKNRDFDVIRF